MPLDYSLLMEKFENVISIYEGMDILWKNSDILTDDLADKLSGRAKELRVSGDSHGAHEFEEWSSGVRSYVTLIQASSINDDNPLHLLEAMKERFDIAFLDFFIEMKFNHQLNIVRMGTKLYLFSWNDIPGNDNKRLIGFLKKRFDIEWVDNAKMEKIDEGKIIRLSFENNFLSLKLNDDETKVILKIDDGRNDEFIAKTEKDKLNIYTKLKNENPDVLSNAIKEGKGCIAFLEIVTNVTKNPNYKAQALMMKGLFLIAQAQFKEGTGKHELADSFKKQAELAFKECIQIREASASVRARAEGNLAMLAFPDRMDEVYNHQKASQSLAEESKDFYVLQTIRRDRAELARQRNDWFAAFNFLKQNIEDYEEYIWNTNSPNTLMDIVDSSSLDFESIVEVCLKIAKQDDSYYERALEFSDMNKARDVLRLMANLYTEYVTYPPRLVQRRNEIVRRMKTISNVFLSLNGKIKEEKSKEYHYKIDKLITAFGVTGEQIEEYANIRTINLQCRPCTFTDMVNLVPPDSVILSYFSLPGRILLFVLDEEGLVGSPVDIPLSRNDLHRGEGDFHMQMHFRSDFRAFYHLKESSEEINGKNHKEGYPRFVLPDRTLHTYYDYLIKPVKDRIKDRKLLYIVPHFNLGHIPFHAFLQPDNRALIDDYAIAYTPSLSILNQCHMNRQRSLKTCFAAGVAAEQGGPESAQKEATIVAQIFEDKPKPATRESVLNDAVECDLIHLACHNYVGNTINSFNGLVLEDGILYPQDILRRKYNASLVTLSGCETAYSDVSVNEKGNMLFVGLIGSFFRTGCPSVVASMWSMPDRTALPMMKAFYTSLKNGSNKAEALRNAQRTIKAEDHLDHPYYWASFSLWGDI